MQWKTANPLLYPLIGFVVFFTLLLAIPVRAAGTGIHFGAYTPLVALFLSGAKAYLLPRGWVLIGLSATNVISV